MRSGVAARKLMKFGFCVLFVAATAKCISAGAVSARGTSGPAPMPLDFLLQFWNRKGGYYLYPGRQFPQSFDAALWARFRSMRVAVQAVRRGKRLCTVQLLGRDMVNYTASDSDSHLSFLFDPRGKGSLLFSPAAPPLSVFFFGLNAKHTHPIVSMGNPLKPAPRVLGIMLWNGWYRVVSRHCQRFSYNGNTNTIRLETRHKGVTAHLLLVFDVWDKKAASRPLAFPTEIDRRWDSRGVVSFVDLRLAARGLFPVMPNHLGKKIPSRIAGMKVRAVTRARAWTIFQADLKFKGKMSAHAAAGRRRFLNWAIGREEAGKLDGWANKGIAPFSSAARTKARGAK